MKIGIKNIFQTDTSNSNFGSSLFHVGNWFRQVLPRRMMSVVIVVRETDISLLQILPDWSRGVTCRNRHHTARSHVAFAEYPWFDI
jgi:hypothetical protein